MIKNWRGFILIIALIFTVVILSFAEEAKTDDALFADDSLFDDTILVETDSSVDDDSLFEDDLFSGDAVFNSDTEIPEIDVTESFTDQTTNPSNLFTSNSVRIGGKMDFSTNISPLWLNPFNTEWSPEYLFGGVYNSLLVPDLSAELFVDARPEDNLRFYGKTQIGYPFETDIVINEATKTTLTIPFLKVKELFTDFSWNDNTYFRFGKHTVKWGVGYFFSPADVINLGAINPEKPTEQLEGPISLRTQVVFPGTQNCMYMYLIADDDSLLARNTAVALKYEHLLGDYEIGLGCWYKFMRSPRFVATLTGSLFNIIGVYAEGVAAYGTEEEWKIFDDSGEGGIVKSGFTPVFQGTAGFSYYWKDPKLTISGQYFYNGFGSSKPQILSELDYYSKIKWYNYAGKHYMALVLSKAELFTSKFNCSLFAIMSLSDLSGKAQCSITWNPHSVIGLSLGPYVIFGDLNSEFTRLYSNRQIGLSLSISMGGGKFSK